MNKEELTWEIEEAEEHELRYREEEKDELDEIGMSEWDFL